MIWCQVNSYKELTVWQRSFALSVAVYRMTAGFPEAERFGLSSQLRRASTSIPANISEGWGRGSTKDYIRFLLMARGSIMELETHSLLAHELGYLRPEPLMEVQREVEELGKMLNGLMQALRNRPPRSNS